MIVVGDARRLQPRRASRYRGRERLALLVLFTYLLPSVVLVIPLYLLMVKIGISNTLFSLVLAYTTFALPYALWLLRSFMAGMPEDLESAALVDGASRLGAFFDVDPAAGAARASSRPRSSPSSSPGTNISTRWSW